MVGLADNALKYEPARAAPAYRELGIGGVRLAVTWRGESALGGTEQEWLDRAMATAGPGLRVVLAVYGPRAADAARRRGTREVLLVRAQRAGALPRGARRRGLERGQQERLLAAAVRLRRGQRRAGRVRRAARALLGRPARVPARREPDRLDVVAGQRQPGGAQQRVPLARQLHPPARRGLPRQWAHASAVRHGRPPSVRRQRGRAALAPAPALDDDRSGRLGEARPGLPRRLRADAPAVPGPLRGRALRIDLVHGGRLPDLRVGPAVPLPRDGDRRRAGARRRARRPAGRAAGGHEPGSGSRDAAGRGDPARVLPALRRRLLQLPAARRGRSRPLAVRRAVGRLEPQARRSRLSPRSSPRRPGGRVDCERMARLVVASGPRDGTAAPSRGGAAAGGGDAAATGGAGAGAGAAAAAFPAPRADVPVLRVAWPASRRFNWRHAAVAVPRRRRRAGPLRRPARSALGGPARKPASVGPPGPRDPRQRCARRTSRW